MKERCTGRWIQRQLAEKYADLVTECAKFYTKYCEIVEYRYFLVIAIAASMVPLLLGCVFSVANVIALGSMLFFVCCVAWCFADPKGRFFTLLMFLMQFTFWLSRPVIDGLRGNQWWYFSNGTIVKAFVAIYISQLALWVGTKYFRIVANWYNANKHHKSKKETFEVPQLAAWCLITGLVITGVLNAYVEISTYLHMKDMDYASVYTNVVPTYPRVIQIFAALFPFAVTANLTMMPKKKVSMIILGSYIVLSVPSLMLGSRNAFVLRVLFAVIYYVVRGIALPKREQWISKRFVVVVLLLVFVLVIFMGAYNYIRGGGSVSGESVFSVLLDFFQKQGTTFDTICQGFEFESQINSFPGPSCYTLGDIVDYFRFSTIGRAIFGISAPGNGNSVEMVMNSNSMAHRLSYAVLGEYSYLAGHGRGTAYIIENYYDGGFLLVAIYNLILGMFLAGIPDFIKNNSFVLNYICLTALTQLYLLPRYSASGFISFIVTPQFWIIPFGVLIIKSGIRILEKRRQNG